MHEDQEEELWQRAAHGDEDAFGHLFDRHADTVFNYCFRRTGDRSLAEDLTATVFLEVWRRRADVVTRHGSILPLLYGVATNVCRNAQRSHRRYGRAIARLVQVRPQPAFDAEVAARVDAEREMQAVLDRVRALPQEELDVVALVIWDELSLADAAAALDIPLGTVKSRLARARKRLERSATPPSVADMYPLNASRRSGSGTEEP